MPVLVLAFEVDSWLGVEGKHWKRLSCCDAHCDSVLEMARGAGGIKHEEIDFLFDAVARVMDLVAAS